nr:MAG: major capsid protein [Microvirus sp.]
MKRSNFNLSHQKKFTADMGYIIPITWYEALPGDILRQSTTALIRMTPLVTPVMHRVFVRIHHFFVPNRLIWDDWENFITGGPDGNDNSVPPTFNYNSSLLGSLYDYMGVPPATYSSSLKISSLPFRAYNLIYNEYYRDQDLVSEVPISKASGNESSSTYVLRKASWPKDYFTTCRPWEQKGDEVVIPVGGTAPVRGIGSTVAAFSSGSPVTVRETDKSITSSYTKAINTNFYLEEDTSNLGYPNVRAYLSEATGIPINDLRLALALQRDMESKLQYGSRYSEVLAHEFGIRNQDARLQKPEYLGGGKSVIQFSEVLSTDGSNTGDMYGHGISAMRTNSFRRFIPEHGIVMSLMSVIPEPLYTVGLNRSFSRETKEDYFDKTLQFIGEQEVYNKEIQASHTDREGIFGYQKRYDEYRYIPSSIAGDMRTTLNTWHYGREFTGDVALNQTFTDCTPTKRTQADLNAKSMIITAYHNLIAKRQIAKNPMPRTF